MPTRPAIDRVEPRLAVGLGSNDAVSFHIDPSRSAEAAQKLFGDALLDTSSAYSAYKRLARLREGKVTLAFDAPRFCLAAGQVRLTEGWIERIASVYRRRGWLITTP